MTATEELIVNPITSITVHTHTHTHTHTGFNYMATLVTMRMLFLGYN